MKNKTQMTRELVWKRKYENPPLDPRTPRQWADYILKERWTSAILKPMNEIELGALYEDVITKAQAQARRQALEEAAQLAEKHVHTWIMGECHYAAGIYAGDQIRELLRDETSEEK